MRNWGALLPDIAPRDWALEQAANGEIHLGAACRAHATCELYGTEDGFDECAEVDTIMHADVIEEIRECCTGFESGDGIDFSADQDREPEQLIAVADGRIGEVAVEKLIATVGAKAERAAERKLLEEACGVTEAGETLRCRRWSLWLRWEGTV